MWASKRCEASFPLVIADVGSEGLEIMVERLATWMPDQEVGIGFEPAAIRFEWSFTPDEADALAETLREAAALVRTGGAE